MGIAPSVKILDANADLIADGDLDAIRCFFAPKYVAHLTGQRIAGGHPMIREFLELYRTAFPKIRVKVEILVEGEDRVAWQRTLRARHDGPYKGFPASGREIVWRDVITSRFQDGLIVEEWIITDLAEQLLMSRKPKGNVRATATRRATSRRSKSHTG